MNVMKKFVHYLFNNPKVLIISLLSHIAPILPDKLYLKWIFRLKMGTRLNLRNPQTFSEKIQWLKLYNRKPEYTKMVDKYAVKEYVASIIGKEYIIPTIGVWDRFEDINFETLPNQFVLKTTHGGGGGGVVICKDKSTFDLVAAKRKLTKSLRQCIYRTQKEWPYKNVSPRIIAEQYIEGKREGGLEDYKFFCFDGEPKCCQVIAGRDNVMTVDFFDESWRHLPFHEPRNIPFAPTPISCPDSYKEMWTLARTLSYGIPFLRVDFYSINGKVFFGELTFFPTSGMGGFNPEEWDYTFGRWIKLPQSNI